MPSVITIDGPARLPKGTKRPAIGTCKRTKKGRLLCYVGKSKKAPTGWSFKKG